MNLDKILRYLVIAGLFAIPFIPLIVVSPMFFPFITGKNFIFRIIVEIITGLWAILAIRDVSYRPKISWLLGSFLTFVAIIAAADFFGENPFKSFWSNFERMEGFVTLLHLLAYFVVMSVVLNREFLWERLFQSSLAASFIMSIYGLLQLGGALTINQGGVRLDGTLGNATYLAIYIVFHVFIALFLMLRAKDLWLKSVYGLLILLQLFIIYHTAARGAILGLFGGVLLAALIIALFGQETRQLRKIAIGTITAVLIVIGLFFAVKNSSFVQTSPVLGRFANISTEETTTKARFLVWNMAYQGFKERPILGWGQENFNYVFNKYYDPRMYAQEQWFDRTHDIIFDWLIAGGILGLLGYLSLFACALYCIWRRGNFNLPEKAVLIGTFGAYFFHNLFVFDNIVSYIIFIILIAYIEARRRGDVPAVIEGVQPQTTKNFSRLSYIGIPLVAIATVFALYFFNAKGVLANITLIKAISPQQEGPVKNLEYFKKALSYNTFGNQEIREQIIQLTVSLRNSSNTDVNLKQEFFQLVQDEMKKMISEAPNDTRHHLFFGALLDTFGFYKEALPYLEKASELSPKKQFILFEIGSNYISSGNYQKALETFKKAYDLEPNFKEARIAYAVGAIYIGNEKLANNLLIPVYGTTLIPDDRIIRAYRDTNQKGKVLEIVKTRLATNPSNAQYHLSVAAAYFDLGQKSAAIAEIRKAIELQSSFKDQGEFYIREIEAGRNP